MQRKIPFIFLFFDLQKIFSSFSDYGQLNDINPQEPSKQLKKKKKNYLTNAIKKFSENFYHSSGFANDLNKAFEIDSNVCIHKILYTNHYEKLISSLIKEHLEKKNLLYYRTSVDYKADSQDKSINCLCKNHENYYDVFTVEKIAEVQFKKKI
ncbi:hypothetical protein GVAV_003410 [Gurleya vavrai]